MTIQPTCPDESVFAELAAGALLEADRHQLELHLDRCPACTELLGLLASPSGLGCAEPGASKSPDVRSWWLSDAAALFVTLMFTQLFWTFTIGSVLLRCLDARSQHYHHGLPPIVFGYVAVVGVLGTILDAICVGAAYRQRVLPRPIILLRAAIGVATLALTPLALVAVRHLLAQESLKGQTLGGSVSRISRPSPSLSLQSKN